MFRKQELMLLCPLTKSVLKLITYIKILVLCSCCDRLLKNYDLQNSKLLCSDNRDWNSALDCSNDEQSNELTQSPGIQFVIIDCMKKYGRMI